MTPTLASPTASDPARAVALRGVVRRLGGRTILDGVDLDAVRGRILVLLGSSGAGKTTILRIVAGLDDPDAGTVEVDGRRVAAPRSIVAPEHRGVGMVFQTLELWPHLSAAENVAFGLPGRPRGRRAEANPRVLEVAAAVGLPGSLLARRPPTMSGGERQRVAIARALAPGPAVLLYDEPLANLDPSRRAEIRTLVRGIAASTGTSAIYVTHDPVEAMEVGDDLVVLAGGRVVERGTPEAVYREPRTLAGARALGAVSAIAARRRADGRAVDCALGPVAAVGDATRDRGLLLLRPEQVAPLEHGAAAQVVDAHPVPGGHAFVARLDGGETVEGRSRAALALGSTVTVGVEGPGALVAAEETTR